MRDQPAASGRQVCCGMTPVDAFQKVAQLRRRDRHRRRRAGEGQMKRPRSSRLAYRHMPCPSCHSTLIRSPRRPRKTYRCPHVRIALERLLDQQRQPIHAAAQVGDAGRDPHPHPRGGRGPPPPPHPHPRARAAASTPASTMIRRPPASTITMRPCRRSPRGLPSSPLEDHRRAQSRRPLIGPTGWRQRPAAR